MKNYVNRLRFSIKYIFYLLFSRHKKGFGIHSQFVYDLIINVFNSSKKSDEFSKIEETRKHMLRKKNKVNLSKKGAGSQFYKKSNIKLSKIVNNSAIPKKYGRLLYKIISYFNINTVIELGTSTGISTLYMATYSNDVKIYTIEGESELAEIAKHNFMTHNRQNIEVVIGSFEYEINTLLKKDLKRLLVFIDGDHRKDATLQYFNQILKKYNQYTIVIIDDIYWNKDMEEAWKIIKDNENVTLTIDVFRMGIVFFKGGITKQNFIIKY